MQDGFDKAFWIFYFAVAWIVFVCGFVWLIVLVNLIRWWHQARKGLVSRVVAWDCLLWLGPALVLLLPWRRTRQLLVPE